LDTHNRNSRWQGRCFLRLPPRNVLLRHGRSHRPPPPQRPHRDDLEHRRLRLWQRGQEPVQVTSLGPRRPPRWQGSRRPRGHDLSVRHRGTMPMPPKWALGYHQCRYSYYPESRVVESPRAFASARFPATSSGTTSTTWKQVPRASRSTRSTFPIPPPQRRSARDGLQDRVDDRSGHQEPPNAARTTAHSSTRQVRHVLCTRNGSTPSSPAAPTPTSG
jgi:hypothetical protein